MAALRPTGLEEPFRREVARRRGLRSGRAQASEEARRWAAVKHEIRSATAGSGPIIVGPWLSEVGFEVLYWIPFLRWAADRFEIDPARLHVISRGGTKSWYGDLAAHYVDVFEYLSPEEFRAHTEARWGAVGGQKQMELNRWDRAVVKAVRDSLPAERPTYLHPSLMYRLFQPFWRDVAAQRHIERHTTIRRFDAPRSDRLEATLPAEPFVAVKFYFRPSFPDIPSNRRIAQDTVSGLARHQKVLLLNTGLNLDDHSELDPGTAGNVSRIPAGIAPKENLLLQSLAISRATSFVGTYGGLAYLAPMYGTPAVALYSEPEHFLPCHLQFARYVARATGGSFTAVGARDRVLLDRFGSRLATTELPG